MSIEVSLDLTANLNKQYNLTLQRKILVCMKKILSSDLNNLTVAVYFKGTELQVMQIYNHDSGSRKDLSL